MNKKQIIKTIHLLDNFITACMHDIVSGKLSYGIPRLKYRKYINS